MKTKINALAPNGDQVFITIRLDDDCKNGHQDFAITANIYEAGKPTSERYCIAGGCCHDDIIAARPDLKLFVDLHLSDYDGVPMYAVENGFYHLRKGLGDTKPGAEDFKAKFCDYYRITGDQFDVLDRCETQIQYALAIQNLGILDHWKSQAKEAIKRLEEMTGEKFVNTSTKSQFHAPTPEEIEAENQRIESGYYTPEAKAQREAEALAAKVEAIRSEAEAKIQTIRDDAEIHIQVLQIGGVEACANCIVYSHTKELVFNWLSYEDAVPQETIEAIAAKIEWPDGYKLGQYKER